MKPESNSNNTAGAVAQERLVLPFFRVVVTKLEGGHRWRIVSNPKWCHVTRGQSAILDNTCNDYAEYTNCGAKGPWDKDAYDGAGNEQEMWNARRDITTSDVQAFLIDAHQRMKAEIRDIPRTGTGTLTRRHKLRGAMDFGIELSNWISRREIEVSRQNS